MTLTQWLLLPLFMQVLLGFTATQAGLGLEGPTVYNMGPSDSIGDSRR